MTVRAGIVVTGTEVLTGRVADRNGPWLAEALRSMGVDVGSVVVVGDRPDDLRAALAFLAGSGVDLLITTGGLGPTADDLTAEVVGGFQGRPSQLDPALERRIADVVERLTAMRGWDTPPEAAAAGIAKQAMVPAGATVLEPVGTAPGLVVPVAESRSGPPVLVLPGPPVELQGMWPAAVAAGPVRRALAGATELRQSTLRLWGTPESELAATLRRVEDQLTGLEVTTCLRDGELEIVTRYAPEAEAAHGRLTAAVEDDYPDTLFSHGPTVDELVATLLDERGWTVAVGEADTGGLVTARLTRAPGASRRVLGGVVAYANEAKEQLLGVPATVLAEHGAVSAAGATALAEGARRRFGADLGIGVSGIAGPGGGTAAKPVGTLHLALATPAGTTTAAHRLRGGRDAVRERATTLVLHELRQLLSAAG
ncbi:competence/damage-inducible protein A [uncultured Modestobacter sp.]|uniref:competence/damage-inducible protein A n=1 Tax=uncultured Modestobacter sp. TaxID=380048 RepID=UPI00261B8588|nr:competence/damage-inducible protein A [uncultured Modestobacter sp.]